VKSAREDWFEGQLDLDPKRLILIDETGASTKMARPRGRARRGQRCRAAIPHGHWKTTTFTAGLRLNGLAAPMLLDGRRRKRRQAILQVKKARLSRHQNLRIQIRSEGNHEPTDQARFLEVSRSPQS
jgi:hypothetical protein